MNWRGEVVHTFFRAWGKAGFPAPELFDRRYRAVIDTHRSRGPSIPAGVNVPPGPLDPNLVGSVYSFGAFVGEMSAHLLGLPSREIEGRLDWPGRFNLGVSLFDYLCDSRGMSELVASLPPFRRLAAGTGANSDSTRMPEEDGTVVFLVQLTTELLIELEREVSSADRLWATLASMLQAELEVSQDRAGSGTDLAHVEDALSRKAAEPFGVIAEWMALHQGAGTPSLARDTASALGRAIGRCYWLMDDAYDVWTDLAEGQWNLLLIRATAAEPRIDLRDPSPATAVQVEKILRRTRAIADESKMAIKELKLVLSSCSSASATRHEWLGSMAASLAQWV